MYVEDLYPEYGDRWEEDVADGYEGDFEDWLLGAAVVYFIDMDGKVVLWGE